MTMLEKDVIPTSEPILRVGIIMPEDNFTQITVSIPAHQPYHLIAHNKRFKTTSGEMISFRITGNTITLNDQTAAPDWSISPEDKYPVVPDAGLKIHQVTAGRGFHWQKKIDVFLPGSVHIRTVQQKVILINELPLEDYLMCVATSEMGQACPPALIQAQTIVARSWMLANVEQKHHSLGMDVCNDDCCQRYQGTSNLNQPAIDAAQATRGQVILFENRICDARYSKSCGGMMESFSTIWGGEELPYLQSIPDSDQPLKMTRFPLTSEENIRHWIDHVPESFCSSSNIDEHTLIKYLGAVDEGGTYFRWHVQYTQQEITVLLNEKVNLQAAAVLDLLALERGGSGRIKLLEIRYIDHNGRESSFFLERDVNIRAALHRGFLYSSCIYIDAGSKKEGIPVNFTIHGAGWGHGVGLCQIGALGMALASYTASDIAGHYYPGCRLETIYP